MLNVSDTNVYLKVCVCVCACIFFIAKTKSHRMKYPESRIPWSHDECSSLIIPCVTLTAVKPSQQCHNVLWIMFGYCCLTDRSSTYFRSIEEKAWIHGLDDVFYLNVSKMINCVVFGEIHVMSVIPRERTFCLMNNMDPSNVIGELKTSRSRSKRKRKFRARHLRNFLVPCVGYLLFFRKKFFVS